MTSNFIPPLSAINGQPENKDAFSAFETPFGDLWIVCDGFGPKGRFASRFAAEQYAPFLELAHEQGIRNPVEALQMATGEIHQRLSRLSEEKGSITSGTTVVLALYTKRNELLIGNIGNSRAYLFFNNHLSPLTNNHGPVTPKVDQKENPEVSVPGKEQEKTLYPALGTRGDVKMEFAAPFPFRENASLLLCSDGLTDFVTNAELEIHLSGLRKQEDVSQSLIDLAVAQASDDNITVIYIPEQALKRTEPLPDGDASSLAPNQTSDPKDSHATLKPLPRLSPKRPASIHHTQPRVLPQGETKTRGGLWLVASFILVLGTFFHLYGLWKVSPYQPFRISELEEDLQTEAENYANKELPQRTRMIEFNERLLDAEPASRYAWPIKECRNQSVANVRDQVLAFEEELRSSMALSSQEEKQLGDHYAKSIEQNYPGKLDIDTEMITYLTKLGEALTANVDRRDISYRFHVIESQEGNAFALPGGHIYFFRGFLESEIQNEAQLAYVMSHEIAHVDQHHCTALLRLIMNLPGVNNAEAMAVIFQLIKHPFGAAYEEQADLLALEQIQTWGYSPFQAALLWGESVEEQPKDPLAAFLTEAVSLLDTHPPKAWRACHSRNQAMLSTRDDGFEIYYIGRINYQEKVPMMEKLH